jgi:hypothetical protein
MPYRSELEARSAKKTTKAIVEHDDHTATASWGLGRQRQLALLNILMCCGNARRFASRSSP